MGVFEFKRPVIKKAAIEKSIEDVIKDISIQLKRTTGGAIVSRHEGIGLLEEEFLNLRDAVRNGSAQEIKGCAIGLAVQSILLIASIDENIAV